MSRQSQSEADESTTLVNQVLNPEPSPSNSGNAAHADAFTSECCTANNEFNQSNAVNVRAGILITQNHTLLVSGALVCNLSPCVDVSA